MKSTWKADAVALGMIAAMLVLAAVSWNAAPDRIPVHWDWTGQPDRFGGRFEGLFGLPLAALGIYALLRVLPRLDPRRRNYEAFATSFAKIRMLVTGVFLGLQGMVLLWIRGERDLNGFLVAGAGLALAGLGNYLPKIKSNWFVGVRTPWTLDSDASWRQTHRLAGWLLSIGGALTFATALLWPSVGTSVLVGVLLATVGISVVYSYFAWKGDETRRAARPV